MGWAPGVGEGWHTAPPPHCSGTLRGLEWGASRLFSWCGWDQAPCTPWAQAPHQRPLLGAHGEASASSPPAALGMSPRACPGRSLMAFGSGPGRGTGSQQQSPPAAHQPGPGLAVGRPGPAYRCERGFLPSGPAGRAGPASGAGPHLGAGSNSKALSPGSCACCLPRRRRHSRWPEPT